MVLALQLLLFPGAERARGLTLAFVTLSDFKDALPDVVAWLILWASIAVLFMVARSVFLWIYAEAPWIRPLLMRAQYARYVATQRREDNARHRWQCVLWLLGGSGPPQGWDVSGRVCYGDILQKKDDAQKVLQAALNEESSTIDGEDAEVIIEFMTHLATSVAKDGTFSESTQTLHTTWASLARDRKTGPLLESVSFHAKMAATVALEDLRQFPRRAFICPTRIGNALATIDDYGLSHYGTTTTFIWSRLERLGAATDHALLKSAFLSLSACLNLSVALALVSVGATVRGLFTLSEEPLLGAWPFIYTGAGLLTSVIAYKAALFSCGGLRTHLTATIDVARRQVLKAMSFDLDALRNFADERKLWAAIDDHFRNPNPTGGANVDARAMKDKG